MVTPASVPHDWRPARLCALRGAITVDEDSPAAVAEAVGELLAELVSANAIRPADILSAIFSATPDIHCLHPAAVARGMGWDDVPMLCVAEMAVDDALPRCVRVLLHLSVTDDRRLRPRYLRGARVLRPDLAAR
jgi:chorismate mutase